MISFIDLYCGAGGASEGFEQAGMQCLLAVDMDLLALKAHKANHPHTDHVLMDMTRPAIDWRKLRGRIEFVHGSPPCQNLSCANRNKDVHKALDTLRAFENAVLDISPRWFTMENVPQVRPHLNGVYTKIRLLNSANYGVPQTRKRIFAGRYPTPIQTHTQNGPQRTLSGRVLHRWVSLGTALNLEGYVNTHRDQRVSGECQTRDSAEPAPTFTTRAGGQWKFIAPQTMARMQKFADEQHNGRMYPLDPNKPSNTITTRNSDSTNTCLWLSYPGSGEPGKGECRAVPRDINDPSFTLVSRPGTIRSQTSGRLLSEEECAILQSFSPDYTFVGNKTQRYCQIGNSIPPLMARAIGRAIIAASGEEKTKHTPPSIQ